MTRRRDGLVRRALCALLALVLLISCAELAPVRAESGGLVRVKLTRLGTPSELIFTADCDYLCAGDLSLNIPAGSSVTLRADGGALTLSCGGVELSCGSSARLLRCGSGVRFQSPSLANVFCGDLYLSASGSAITAVLHLPMEDYLCGVVGYEMSNSYPLEALKVQAVAARNYALKKLSTQASRSYDVVDTSADQVFRGFNASQTRVIQAVQETAGQVLYSGGTLASCYYTASNGGQTESTKNVWGGVLSYSVVKDDPYDLGNAAAKKNTARIAKDASGLQPALEKALLEGVQDVLEGQKLSRDAADVEIRSIERITAKNPKYAAPSRLYRTLAFELRVQSKRLPDGAPVTLAATVDVPTYGGLEDWYGLSINSASNETVEVTDEGDCFCVNFRRFGHGIGMSARGAQAMARDYGMGMEEILSFYYPGTELRTVSLAGASYASPAGGGDAVATACAEGQLLLYADATGGSACARVDDGLALRVLGAQGARVLVEIRGLRAWAPVEGLRDFALIDEMFEPALGEMALRADAELLELPLEGARVIQTLPSGARVRLLERSESWARVEAEDGARGYLPAALLCEAEATETPAPSETPEPSETPVPTATITPTATSTPTASVSPTASATPTASPTATATATPTATLRPTASPTSIPAPTLRPDPTAVDRPLPTGVPLPTLAPTGAPSGAEGMFVPYGALYRYVQVGSGSTLTLRSKPSTSASAVGTLARGARVKVLAFNEDWAMVEAQSGARGFAALRYLSASPVSSDQPAASDAPRTPEPTAAPEPEDAVKTVDLDVVFCSISARTTAKVAMYQKNSTSSKCVCTIPANAKLTVTAYDKTWAYVKYGSKRGFVQHKYLEK